MDLRPELLPPRLDQQLLDEVGNEIQHDGVVGPKTGRLILAVDHRIGHAACDKFVPAGS